MTRQSKAEQLEAQIAASRERLAKLHAELDPQIAVEQARIEGLQRARDAAERARSRALDAWQTARDRAQEELFPSAKAQALRAQVRSFVTERGFPEADVARLAARHMSALTEKHPEVARAHAAYAEAGHRKESAYREWNVATSPAGAMSKMQWRIEEATRALRKLERELERLPQRREAARERRADAKREEQIAEQTKAAEAAMSEFTFFVEER